MWRRVSPCPYPSSRCECHLTGTISAGYGTDGGDGGDGGHVSVEMSEHDMHLAYAVQWDVKGGNGASAGRHGRAGNGGRGGKGGRGISWYDIWQEHGYPTCTFIDLNIGRRLLVTNGNVQATVPPIAERQAERTTSVDFKVDNPSWSISLVVL